jgi:uncharacterized membrane protein
MRGLGFVLKLFRSPVEGVTFIFSAGLFGYALYVLSPLYVSNYPSAVSEGLNHGGETALVIFFLLTTLPGLLAPFMRKRERALKLATFSSFVSFLFLFILRVAIFGWLPVIWLPLIMISLASAYLHVYLKVRKE